MASIKRRIAERFPDAQFGKHESDLYVKQTPEIMEFLKNEYEYFCNIESFVSQIDGKRWIDIPFANMSGRYKAFIKEVWCIKSIGTDFTKGKIYQYDASRDMFLDNEGGHHFIGMDTKLFDECFAAE